MFNNNPSERVKLMDIGFYYPGGGNISDEMADVFRTGQTAAVTQAQQLKVDSPTNIRFNAHFLLFLIAGVFILACVKTAVSGNFDISKAMIMILLAAVCAAAGVLVKGKETSSSALANEGKQEAYIHTVQNKEYMAKEESALVNLNFIYIITVKGMRFSVSQSVYEQLSVGGDVTCVISASGGMYYIDFFS